MADINKLIPLILKWEGGYVNDPKDLGGPTKMGVTLNTWMAQGYDKDGDGAIDAADLKLVAKDDVVNRILRPHYWERWHADCIQNQSIANILVDWVWGSGKYGIVIPQTILKVKVDGLVGKKTLDALNNYPDQETLFDRIKSERIAYIERICLARPANLRFKKGWLNRLADFRFSLMAGVLFLFLCLSGCKSIPAETNFYTQSEINEKLENEIQVSNGKQSNRSVSKQLFRDSEENSVSQTIVTQYDTSLPKDTLTGAYPIKSVAETITLKGIKMTVSEDETAHATARELSKQTETRKATVRNTEEIRQQQSVKDPYRWRYIATAIIAVMIGCFWKFRHSLFG